MGVINNLSQPQLNEIFRRLKALENGSPMNNGAVGRSGFEVYDNGTINVSSGNIIGAGIFSWQGSFSQSGTSVLSGATTIAGPTGITGQLTIQGATSVTGPFTVTGDTKLNGKTDVGGAFTVTGVTKLNGATTVGGDFEITTGGLFKAGQSLIRPDGSAKFGLFEIAANGNLTSKGTLSIEGVTTLKSDLNVTTGKVKVGTMTLDPTVSGGALTFGNGSQVFTDSTTIQMFKGNGAAQVTAAAAMLVWGGSTLSVDATGARVGNPRPTTNAANVYMDANGYLFRKSP